MRLLHTADWHLGHTLREQPRDQEHDAFLRWLLGQLEERAVDALIIAGDVFDSANPTSAALRVFYGFLADALQARPSLDIVVVGGNHDSPARLDAPRPLYDAAGVHVVGALPRGADGGIDAERLVLPLTGADGRVGAWVVAMPFLRPADLPRVESGDPLISGVRALYAEALDLARERVGPGQALLATGHCYMAQTRLSERSERKILGGNQHALPPGVFPDDVAYVALGHLHLAQAVGAPHIRYSGSPIPLSLTEADYPHQVVQVDLDGGRVAAITEVPVPRQVGMIRVPAGAPSRLDAVLAELEALEARPADLAQWRRPFLEVSVAIEGSAAEVRPAVEAALEGKAARLISLRITRLDEESSLADSMPRADLLNLDEEAVFRRRWQSMREGVVPRPVLAAFHELLHAVRAEEG